MTGIMENEFDDEYNVIREEAEAEEDEYWGWE